MSCFSLSTVSQRPEEQSRHAVTAAVERLDEGRIEPREVVLTPRLVVRDTTTGPTSRTTPGVFIHPRARVAGNRLAAHSPLPAPGLGHQQGTATMATTALHRRLLKPATPTTACQRPMPSAAATGVQAHRGGGR
ncbi:substrate-binding domain-containing protein [Streptomyces decoyicus]